GYVTHGAGLAYRHSRPNPRMGPVWRKDRVCLDTSTKTPSTQSPLPQGVRPMADKARHHCDSRPLRNLHVQEPEKLGKESTE
ncbi:MAG: hypothetical protein ABIP48_25485, partial [Planctomycetota bacterium]